MRTTTWTKVLGTILGLPLALWFAAQAFGFGVGFDATPPPGATLLGRAAVGTITYSVTVGNPGTAIISFDGVCGNNKNKEVHTGGMDFSAFTDETAFLTASDNDIAASVEGVVLELSSFQNQVGEFGVCWNNFVAVFVLSAKTHSRLTPASWVGDVTIQGFHF